MEQELRRSNQTFKFDINVSSTRWSFKEDAGVVRDVMRPARSA